MITMWVVALVLVLAAGFLKLVHLRPDLVWWLFWFGVVAAILASCMGGGISLPWRRSQT